ncbi:MAG: hypothetical protein JWN00_4541 [Actinomycetia bacterium]|nr:hypothetical protein [Actinomycetes bacterium]
MSTLEYRYRSLLAWYPVEHRVLHEEEMLSVLLAGAHPDQTRPTPAETFDLIRGALRIRARHLTGGPATPWRDALAITGLIATVLLVAEGLRFALNVVPPALRVISLRHAGLMHVPLPRLLVIYLGTVPYWIAWAVIAVLALLGVRRSATIGACAVTGVQVAASWYGTNLPTFRWSSLAANLAGGVPLVLAVLATASLLLSPGPRYGAALLGRRQVGGAVVLAGVLVAFSGWALGDLVTRMPHPMTPQQAFVFVNTRALYWHHLQFAVLVVSTVIAVAWLARSAAGRRACALLAVPVGPVLLCWGNAGPGGPNSTSLRVSELAPIGLVGLVLVMLGVRLAELPGRHRARGRQGDTASREV